jgi:hypothetical protein
MSDERSSPMGGASYADAREQDRAMQAQEPLARKRGELAVRYPGLAYCGTPGCDASVGLGCDTSIELGCVTSVAPGSASETAPGSARETVSGERYCAACMQERELHEDPILMRLQLTTIRLWNESKAFGEQALQAHAAYGRAKERYQARREHLLSARRRDADCARHPLAS